MGADEIGTSCLGPRTTPEALLSLAASAARDVLASPGTPEPARRALAAISSVLSGSDATVLLKPPDRGPALWLTAASTERDSVPDVDGNAIADLLTIAVARAKTIVAGVGDGARLPPAWQKAGIAWAAAIPLILADASAGGMVVRGVGDPPDRGTIACLESIGCVVVLGMVCGWSRAMEAKVEDITRLLGCTIDGQERERARIARELHDETNQSLTSLLLSLALLARVVEAPAAREHIARVRAHAAEVLDSLRRVAQGLRPPDLMALGLGPALESLCETFADQHGIAARFYHVEQDCPCRSEAIDVALYRIAQEALANVARHAQATQVGVVLACRDGLVTVQIEDDGNGHAGASAVRDAREGLGILGMKERAALLGGKVSIESNPGRGTTVYVEIPASLESQGDP